MIVQIPLGILEANCYLVYDEASKEGVIVDPGGDTTPLRQAIEQRGITIKAILNTHGHFDHSAGNVELASFGVPLGIHPADRELLAAGGGASWFGLPTVPAMQPTLTLTEGFEYPVGNVRLRVLETPGHTPGSICLYSPEENALLTGDTLFAGGIGRTDLPGGDPRALTASLTRLLALPPETIIYPGHGPTSTLAQERRHNPWLRFIAAR
ncbi:MAG: MBL fold metallo-hydrolase [Anaerolineae bacterium]